MVKRRAGPKPHSEAAANVQYEAALSRAKGRLVELSILMKRGAPRWATLDLEESLLKHGAKGVPRA